MTDPRSELERLVAEWRRQQHFYAARADATLERNYDPSGITNQAISNTYKTCADQLSAILQRSPQQEEEKDDKT